MFNIIGNSCVSSNITFDILKQPYINPFCWNIIDYVSFGFLIKNYRNINFNNFILKKHNEKEKYYLIIDNNVRVFYEHYVEDKEQKEVLKKNNNVYYCDIRNYIIEKYNSRLQLNDKPIFISGSSWDIDKPKHIQMEYIINQNIQKYPLIVIVNMMSDYEYLKKYENDYTKIYITNLVKNNVELAFNIFTKYKELFKNNDDGKQYSEISYNNNNTKVS